MISATREACCESLEAAGLPLGCPILAVRSRRLAQAYPIYTRDYREHFERLDGWLEGIAGLVTFERQGLLHDNTHHALAMAYAVEECIDDSGDLDSAQWAKCCESFRKQVVED